MKYLCPSSNTARKFFKEYETSAKILGIPAKLIKDIGTIWTVLTCGFKVDTDKFGEKCKRWHDEYKESSIRKVEIIN